MGHVYRLDQAARLAGKAEITVRRLVRGKKIPYERQKGAGGFYYLVDPEDVRAFYNEGSAKVATAPVKKTAPIARAVPAAHETPHKGESQVRIAVVGESGSPMEYWQKRAEIYEERYHQELRHHGQTKQEMGEWRGRAEQAQSMMGRFSTLPALANLAIEATSEAPVSETTPTEPVMENISIPAPIIPAAQAETKSKTTQSPSGWAVAVVVILVIVIVLLVAILALSIAGHGVA